MQLNTTTITAVAAIFFVIPALAAEISPEQAGRAAKAWVDRDYAMGRLPAGRSVAGVEEVSDTATGAELRIVSLEGGGFVVTSADDLVEPIIAFSETGDGVDTDEANPFWALLRSDIAAREAAAGVVRGRPSPRAASSKTDFTNNTASSRTESQRKWDDLLGRESGVPKRAAGGLPSLSETRVEPFVKSKWSQSAVSGKKCWNYYTPSNYVCGCVATAIAQIMRYWQYPTASVAAKTWECAIDGQIVSKTMKGGTYAWTSMPLTPSSSAVPTDAQCQAMGKLTYDVGVSVGMSWTSDGSGASMSSGMPALKEDFGYASAVSLMYESDYYNWSIGEFKKAVIPNLDAKRPVGLSISGSGGHAILADGYGYSGDSFYIHVNMGWSGSSDAWYCPPDIEDYTSICGVLCNVSPSEEGNILSGRITTKGKLPLSGATVALLSGDTTLATASTDENGIYALASTTTGSFTVKVTYEGQTATTTGSLSTTTPVNLANRYGYYYHTRCAIGNNYGNDITLDVSSVESMSVTFDRQGGTGGTASATATYGSAMPSITPPARTGYTFGGYYTAGDGGGTQYYTASGASARDCNITGAITLYAKWTANTYAVTLDSQGGSGGSASATATYGSAMPAITLPTRTGYTFGGYYTAPNGDGTQYYRASGASARNWNMTGAITLYAKWTVSTYTITLNRPNGIGGSASVTVTYGLAMPAITVPTRTGYTFGGYYTAMGGGGTQYYTSSGASARDWDKTYAATLYAKWTVNTYEVAFHANGGEGEMPNQTNTYGAAVAIASNVFTHASHRYLGWATNETGEVVFRDGEVVSNLTAVANGVIDLFAIWQLIAADVSLDLGDGTTTDLALVVGETTGGQSGPGDTTAVPEQTYPDYTTTLYAVWAKPTYKVAFYANGGKGKMAAQTFKYGKSAKLKANKFKRKGYTFKGWATSKANAKKGKVAYKNKAKVKNLVKNGKTVKLYAVWKKK